MKKILTALFVSCLSFATMAQTFQGEIIYKNTFKTKNPQVSNEQWESMLGSKQEYFIKGGDYKVVANGTYFQWQMYINKDNKSYSKTSNSPSVFWIDAAVNTDSVLKVEVKKSAAVILGYTCDEITMTCKSGVQKYYYNAKQSVDVTLYTKHKSGNWYYYLSKAKALPLKSIIETDQCTIESVATEVKPMTLSSTMFTLPAGTKLEKSPY
jgi:hypothetical protein